MKIRFRNALPYEDFMTGMHNGWILNGILLLGVLYVLVLVVPFIFSILPIEQQQHPPMDYQGFLTGFKATGMAQDKISKDSQ